MFLLLHIFSNIHSLILYFIATGPSLIISSCIHPSVYFLSRFMKILTFYQSKCITNFNSNIIIMLKNFLDKRNICIYKRSKRAQAYFTMTYIPWKIGFITFNILYFQYQLKTLYYFTFSSSHIYYVDYIYFQDQRWCSIT